MYQYTSFSGIQASQFRIKLSNNQSDYFIYFERSGFLELEIFSFFLPLIVKNLKIFLDLNAFSI